MASRKEVADALKEAAAWLFFKYRYSCTFELGVNSWGQRRADIVGCKVSGALVIIEVKSCMADLKNDKKWTEYRHYTDKLYLCFTSEVWEQVKAKEVKLPPKVGVIALGADGYARIVRKATTLPLTPENRMSMLARLAWRNGDLSKRVTRSRKRVFLPTKQAQQTNADQSGLPIPNVRSVVSPKRRRRRKSGKRRWKSRPPNNSTQLIL